MVSAPLACLTPRRARAYALRCLRAQRDALLTFALALIVRVSYNLTLAKNYVPTHDAHEYVLLAQHMLQWGCYCTWLPDQPTTGRTPIFPLFLAGVFATTGSDPLHARLALSVVGALTCVVIGLLARELFGTRTGLLAGLIAATYPQLFIEDSWLYSESLAIFLFALSCLVVMRVARRPTTRGWLGAGALLGVTALARPNGVYALGALLLWLGLALWQRRLAYGPALRAGALSVLAFALVIAPWAVRNYIVTDGSVVPFSTGSGVVIAGAYSEAAYIWPDYSGTWVNPWHDPFWSATDQAKLASFSPTCWGPCEPVRSTFTTQLGLTWARTHLSLLPSLLWMRMERFWTPASAPNEAGMPVWRGLAVWYPLLVFGLAAVGLWALRRRWYDALVPLLFGLTVIGGALVFYGTPRFRAPLEPILVVLAAGGIMLLAEHPLKRLLARAQSAYRSRRPGGHAPLTLPREVDNGEDAGDAALAANDSRQGPLRGSRPTHVAGNSRG